jgi:hypothetical protein
MFASVPVGTTIAMAICRFHWSGFSGAQVIRFLRFTGQLQLCGCMVQYLSQCSSVVFFPDPVADVCRFKGLGLRAQQRQVCLCQSYAFASFAHSPSVLLLVAVVCTVTDVLGRDPSSAVVLLVVAIMRLLQFFGCPCILLALCVCIYCRDPSQI